MVEVRIQPVESKSAPPKDGMTDEEAANTGSKPTGGEVAAAVLVPDLKVTRGDATVVVPGEEASAAAAAENKESKLTGKEALAAAVKEKMMTGKETSAVAVKEENVTGKEVSAA